MYQFVKKMIAFRKENSELLSKGQIKWLKVDDKQKVIEIERQMKGKSVRAIFNFGQNNISLNVKQNIVLEQNFKNGNLCPQGLVVYNTDC